MSISLPPNYSCCPIVSLFINLWRTASAWQPHQRSTATDPGPSFNKKAENAIKHISATEAFDTLNLLIGADALSSDSESIKRGKILAVMRSIDKIFLCIHPRALILPADVAKRPVLPNWLRELRGWRALNGNYGGDEQLLLIPRGPLLRMQRKENASSADCLADRFAALAVVPKISNHDGRTIHIQNKQVGADLARGVVPGKAPGEEIVTFIPVAENADDIVLTQYGSPEKLSVAFQAHSTLEPAKLVAEILSIMEHADIVMAPEFVMSEAEADKLQESLRSTLRQSFRVILAGSGPTLATDDDLPWNEARILNGKGAELWRQRKMVPAGLNQRQAKQYDLSDPGEVGQIFEHNAGADEVVIMDIDSLGRCIVLICQDIVSNPFSEELIRHFQPDWVFTPVLDNKLAGCGWVHQRALALSEWSQARFLIVNSTAFADKLGLSKETFGLAIGPKAATNDDEGRVCALVPSIVKSVPGYGSLTWRTGKWGKTKVSIDKS
jgi:hypothetical protein